MSVTQKRKVLVLNKGWNAIGVVSLERAIVMLFSTHECGTPKAKIIDPTREFQTFTWEKWSELKPKMDDEVIRSANMTFRVPEVILLSKYDKMPQHKIHFSRRTIYKRDNNQCQYCGATPGTEELTIDHIIPRSKGGLTTWDNCVLACVDCNSKKANRMPDRTTVVEHVKDEHGNPKDKFVNAFTVYFSDGKKKTIKQPTKPNFEVYKGEIPYRSWSQWLNIAYWNCELANDNETVTVK